VYFQNWYDSLDKESKEKADEFIAKVKKIDPDAEEDECFVVAQIEIEDNKPALAEFKFANYLKKSLKRFDENQEEKIKSIAEDGYDTVREIVRKVSDAGITPNEIMTLMKACRYDGIMDTINRFEHIYFDNLDDSMFPSFVISEVGTDNKLTGRYMNVHDWISYFSPHNGDS
jgi:hypothetical protein